MKQRKVSRIDNPVLHFGSDVARDLVKEIQDHFSRGFKHLAGFHKEIHEGMFKAMQDNRQADEVRKWLLAKCGKGQSLKVGGLVRRYCRILDNDWRKVPFLEGKRDFWEASRTTHGPKPSEDRFLGLVHEIVVCCVKTGRDHAVCCQRIREHRDLYEREHDWPA
jgi:hypothetical protein